MGFEGKVVAITGASSGIGEATARRLAANGAIVLMGARRLDRLKSIAADVERAGGVAIAVQLDVTRRADLNALVETALERFGRLDVMVGNAGLMPLSLMSELKVDEWERMVDVNIKGVLYGIAAALPVFHRQKEGHFIHITSIADRLVTETSGVYSGTKFAVRAISEGLRQEVGAHIRVTIIAPGTTDTELPNTITNPDLKAALMEHGWQDMMPPDTIAGAIAYAMSQPPQVDVNEIVIRPTSSRY